MTLTDIHTEPMIDEPPPAWVGRRRRSPTEGGPVDTAALERAMQGGVPAEVAAYAPKPRVIDAGKFSEDTDRIKNAIIEEAAQVAAALRKHADAIVQAASEQCDAIDLAVTDANMKQQAARTMAEAFARVSGDITGQVKKVLAAREAPVLEAGAREGAQGEE